MSWALSVNAGSPGRKAVLLALANRHNADTGLCFPSLSAVAHETEMTERAVRRHLAGMEGAGLLRRVARYRPDGSQTSNVYVLSFQQELSTPPDSAVRPPRTAVSAHEPEVEPAGELKLSSARARDLVWDALVEVFGAAPAGLERGRWNKACQSLKEAGATPEDVFRAASAYRKHPSFRDCVMTPTALAANWTVLTASPQNTHDLEAARLRQRIATHERMADG